VELRRWTAVITFFGNLLGEAGMTAATHTGTQVASRLDDYFYFYMALLCALAAFGGFLPTFWLPMARGGYVAAPVIAIHGLLFSGWILFFILQTWFVASRQVANHRAAGLFGIALASVMTVFGFLVVINEIQRAGAAGNLDAGLSFSILPLSDIVFFAVFVALAIMNIRRPEWHKRFMLVATISLLNAPIARLFIYFVDFHGHMPVVAGLPAPPAPIDAPFESEEYVIFLILLIPIIYDWMKRGRPHSAYLFGGGTLVLMYLLQAPISHTAAWHTVAQGFLSLAG
jgi:hypothetical protein